MSVNHSPLRIAATGSGPDLSRWLEQLADTPGITTEAVLPIDDLRRDSFSRADVWLIGGHSENRLQIAAEVVRSSCHVFLAWPPPGTSDACISLARLADEAGVDVGVDRPGFGSSLLREIPDDSQVSLATISCSIQTQPAFEDLVDMCHQLSANSPARRVWATRTDEGSLQVALRFQSGLFAVLTLRSGSSLPDTVFLSGNGFSLEGRIEQQTLIPWTGTTGKIGTSAIVHFVTAIQDRRPGNVSISNSIETLRTIEAIRERLGEHV